MLLVCVGGGAKGTLAARRDELGNYRDKRETHRAVDSLRFGSRQNTQLKPDLIMKLLIKIIDGIMGSAEAHPLFMERQEDGVTPEEVNHDRKEQSEMARMRNRVEQLRGALKSASGWFRDLGDDESADKWTGSVQRLATWGTGMLLSLGADTWIWPREMSPTTHTSRAKCGGS